MNFLYLYLKAFGFLTDELEALLSENGGMNFLRSHGNNTKKFISKQGLEKVFVECEQRMWRVGERNLPQGTLYRIAFLKMYWLVAIHNFIV